MEGRRPGARLRPAPSRRPPQEENSISSCGLRPRAAILIGHIFVIGRELSRSSGASGLSTWVTFGSGESGDRVTVSTFAGIQFVRAEDDQTRVVYRADGPACRRSLSDDATRGRAVEDVHRAALVDVAQKAAVD